MTDLCLAANLITRIRRSLWPQTLHHPDVLNANLEKRRAVDAIAMAFIEATHIGLGVEHYLHGSVPDCLLLEYPE